MTVTTESGGRQNAFPNEPVLILMIVYHMKVIHKTLKKLMVVGL